MAKSAKKEGEVATPSEKLADILSELDSGLTEDASQVQGEQETVLRGEILMPDMTSISAEVNRAAAGNKTLAALDPSLAAQLSNIENALGHSETVRTVPSAFTAGNKTAQMPREVRDTANSLYYKKGRNGKPYYVRERADKLLEAIFGDELSDQVKIMASNHGFHMKPLLWVAQSLWHDVEFDTSHEFVGEFAFNEAVDMDNKSALVKALYTCFYHMTIRNVQRLAKEHKISCLSVIRCIFKDLCAPKKVSA